MRVNFGRCDIRMAQQHLQGPEISASFQQVGGKGMAQDVGADAVGRYTCSARQILNHLKQSDPA
jgi:hypothetical protein